MRSPSTVFDERGNLLTETDPLGAVTAYTYDESTVSRSSVTDALGGVQQVECDAAGCPCRSPISSVVTTWCGATRSGASWRSADPLGQVTRLGWRVEGKPSWRETADGAREVWTWDGEGNLLTHTDANGGTTVHEVGTFDLPASRTDADGVTYAFTHDTELRLTGVTNPQGRTWSYVYDAAGRLASETDFNGRTLTYGHDAAGAVTERTNGAGETIAITRDTLGRITEQRLPDGAVTRFGYGPDGDLLSAVNPHARIGSGSGRGRPGVLGVGRRRDHHVHLRRPGPPVDADDAHRADIVVELGRGRATGRAVQRHRHAGVRLRRGGPGNRTAPERRRGPDAASGTLQTG